MLRKLLQHPITKDIDLDSSDIYLLRKRIIKEKPFLRKLYKEWYSLVYQYLINVKHPILEIGSGGGFLEEFIPGLIKSEILRIKDLTMVLDAQSLPFKKGSLQAIVMLDVLHHLPNTCMFFNEAIRCLKPNGRIVMIEPWATTWSTFFFTKFHHEAFNKQAKKWEFPSKGPLSSANGALPWIIFSRDRKKFEQDFPKLSIKAINLMMPFAYILSGGVSMRSIIPGCCYQITRKVEHFLTPWICKFAMFALIVVERR